MEVINLTSVITEFPEAGGILLHIQGIKPPDLTIKSARVRLLGDEFWQALSKILGNSIVATFRIAAHPILLSAEALNPKAFTSGVTRLRTSICLGGVGKYRAGKHAIMKKGRRIVAEGNPCLTMEFEFGEKKTLSWKTDGILFRVKTTFADILASHEMKKALDHTGMTSLAQSAPPMSPSQAPESDPEDTSDELSSSGWGQNAVMFEEYVLSTMDFNEHLNNIMKYFSVDPDLLSGDVIVLREKLEKEKIATEKASLQDIFNSIVKKDADEPKVDPAIRVRSPTLPKFHKKHYNLKQVFAGQPNLHRKMWAAVIIQRVWRGCATRLRLKGILPRPPPPMPTPPPEPDYTDDLIPILPMELLDFPIRGDAELIRPASAPEQTTPRTDESATPTSETPTYVRKHIYSSYRPSRYKDPIVDNPESTDQAPQQSPRRRNWVTKSSMFESSLDLSKYYENLPSLQASPRERRATIIGISPKLEKKKKEKKPKKEKEKKEKKIKKEKVPPNKKSVQA